VGSSLWRGPPEVTTRTSTALKRAISLLGQKAVVGRRLCGYFKERPGKPGLCSGCGPHPQPCRSGLPLYTVGRIEMGMFNMVKGEGFTWEEALARTEQAVHEDSCRRCLLHQSCKAKRLLKEKADALNDAAIVRLGLWWSIREIA